MKKFYNNAGLNKSCSVGQVMILTTVVIGGLLLSASVVAGFLMFNQLRQVNDAVTSGMAVFATDAGVEDALYCYFYTQNTSNKDISELCNKEGSLSNLASYASSLYCVGLDKKTETSCLESNNDNVYGFRVFATGTAHSAKRILGTFFSTKAN